MARISLNTIQEELSKENWTLTSNEYQNLDTELVLKCPEGHTVYTSWRKWREKHECPACKQNKYKENKMIIREKKKDENRIIGLDQSSRRSGYAVMDGTDLVYYGVFEASGADEVARIHEVKLWLMSLIENWKPDLIGIEGIQYEQNFGVTTFQTLARLQGVIMDLCYELNVPFQIAPTGTWRSHCGVKGRSRADKKRSMQLLVKEWFDITVSDDESDAIGLAKYTAETHQKKTAIISWE